MRRGLFVWIVSLLCLVSRRAYGQSDTQSAAFIETALKAIGANTLTDVTITGTAQLTHGSTTETTSATLEASLSGSTKISYVGSSTAPAEARVMTDGIWSGAWTDTLGKLHPIAYHNMMSEPDWFFPMLTLVRGSSTGGVQEQTITYVGPEIFNGTAVQHLRLQTAAGTASKISGLGQSELYLNTATLLPVALTYNDHPDATVLIDIPVKILYSGYSPISGIVVPTRVQQYWNGTLTTDLQIQSITLNTGLTISIPAVQ